MKVSILLPAYKSEKLLSKVFCKSYFNLYLDNPDIELIIYDNGGNGKDLDVLRNDNNYSLDSQALLGIKVVGDGVNVGLNKALNACFEASEGEFIYMPHTDMMMMPGCLESLIGTAKNQAPGKYLFCSRSIEKTSHIPMQLLKDFGTTLEDFNEEKLNEYFKSYKDKGIVTGYRMPFFGHRKLLLTLREYNVKNNFSNGPFDDSFFSYATDNDLFFSCYDIGVRRFWMIEESVVYHLSGHSNNQQSVDKNDKKPYIRLCEKWKALNVTMNIDASEQNLIPWNFKVK